MGGNAAVLGMGAAGLGDTSALARCIFYLLEYRTRRGACALRAIWV